MDKNYIRYIQHETDFIQYINMLSALKECIVVIAVKDTIGFSVQLDGFEALKVLGLSKIDCNVGDKAGNHWKGYVAVFRKGELIFEKIGMVHEAIFYKNTFNDINLDVVSAPLHGGNIASILVNGEEYSVNKRGFNIVTISFDGKVRDSVAFDTHNINRTCVRKFECMGEGLVFPHNEYSLFNRNLEETKKRLDINYIIHGYYEDNESYKKIKVRIYFYGWYVFWTAIESLVEAFEDDPRYDILFIMETNHKKTWEIVSQGNRKLIISNKYNITEDDPDIIIYNSEIFGVPKRRATSLSVYICAGLNNGGVLDFAKGKWMELVENRLNADLYLAEKYLAKRKNWYGVGNPKFDIIYRNVSRVSKLPKSWEKLKDKTVILWAPDHKWAQKDLTFDLYAKPFFDYFRDNVDMGLIIRMHPSYPRELISARIWSEKDLQRLIDFANSFPNIVWDDRKDYGLAYSMANAVLTDINCGITISSLPLDIPVAVLLRYDGEVCKPNYPDVISAHCQIHSVDEAVSFFDDVKHGKDPLKEKRRLIKSRYVANFDGKNGMRIKEFIEKKYFDNLRT